MNTYFAGIFKLSLVLPMKYMKLNVQQIKLISQYVNLKIFQKITLCSEQNVTSSGICSHIQRQNSSIWPLTYNRISTLT